MAVIASMIAFWREGWAPNDLSVVLVSLVARMHEHPSVTHYTSRNPNREARNIPGASLPLAFISTMYLRVWPFRPSSDPA